MNIVLPSVREHDRWDRTVTVALPDGGKVRTLDLEGTVIQALLHPFRDNFADLLHCWDVRLKFDASPDWDPRGLADAPEAHPGGMEGRGKRLRHRARRSDAAMARAVDDEVVILDVPSGRDFGLNDVGAMIWDPLDGDHDRDAILDAITDEFDIDRTTATADLDSLLTEPTGAGLIVDAP